MAAPLPVSDVIIVGFGPAGATAAIYAARKKLSVALFGELPGGEVRNSGEVENWPGDGVTTGAALAAKFARHVELHRDMVAVRPDKITAITKEGNGEFAVTTAAGEMHRARTVIYAAGRHPRKLGVPGEEEFRNRGVTYCATCDAPLFAGRDVAVVGGGNAGVEAVIMLQKIAGKIYVIQNMPHLTADPVLREAILEDPKVEVIYGASVKEIKGKVMVDSLTYESPADNKGGTLKVGGVFVAIGAVPNTAPVKELLTLKPNGAIPADRYGATEVPGFFAAGDVTDVRDAQIVVAAGQGCSAALSAADYIVRL